jgi:hypothetical protein
MLRKTRVVRKVETGIDSDEEGAVLPPTTTTHRYNYAVPLEITDGGLVQQDEITLWVNLLCVAVDEPHNNLCLRDNHLGILLGPHKNISQKFPKSLSDFEPSKQRSPSSYASMLRKTRVVRKVERGIDSDEEGVVLPPTTTHRYNYAVDKVKALAHI